MPQRPTRQSSCDRVVTTDQLLELNADPDNTDLVVPYGTANLLEPTGLHVVVPRDADDEKVFIELHLHCRDRDRRRYGVVDTRYFDSLPDTASILQAATSLLGSLASRFVDEAQDWTSPGADSEEVER